MSKLTADDDGLPDRVGFKFPNSLPRRERFDTAEALLWAVNVERACDDNDLCSASP